MDKKLITGIVILVIVGLIIAGYLYWRSIQKEKPLDAVTENLEKATESVPQITTNPAEGNVPELNPVERVNPFKYENPLR